MKNIYSRHTERRDGLSKSTGQARRWYDKAFSFAVFLLLVFLLNWTFGCSAALRESDSAAFGILDCHKEPEAFRCQVYEPEPDTVFEEDIEDDIE